MSSLILDLVLLSFMRLSTKAEHEEVEMICGTFTLDWL